MMLKDPKVETTQTIKEFHEKHKFSTENSLILKADTGSAMMSLFRGMASGFYVFDKDGNQLCYLGSGYCQGEQFYQLISSNIDSFSVCNRDSVSLDKVLARTYDLNEQPVTKTQLPIADYYLVSYWQKFMGGKKGYEEAVSWMEDELKKKKPNVKFSIIKINTDLQANWGLVAGKKAKMNWKRKGKQITMEITDLPVK
jgi:hypothetical protein